MTLLITDFTALYIFETEFFLSYCCCSIVKSWPTLCDPMDCSTPGFSVLHYLPEISQFMSTESVMLAHSWPLLLWPSIFLSTSVFSNELPLCIPWPKYWSLNVSLSLPKWIFRLDFLCYWLLWSPCSPRDSRIFSSTTIWNHQFFGIQSSLWSNIHTWLLEKP